MFEVYVIITLLGLGAALNKNPKKEVIGPRGKLFGPDGPAIIKDYFPGYIKLI